MPYGYVSVRRNALCPRCLALERHRVLWLWLERESDLLRDSDRLSQPRFLHIAPEVCLMRKFEAIWAKAREERRVAHDTSAKANGGESEVFSSGRRLKPSELLLSESYITADLESPLARVHFDVQAIPFPDESFDVIFCNHVLEHVADDRAAMREMWRVMRPGGWGVMLSPVDISRTKTFEDDTIVDRRERTRLFGQYDHRRVYGTDYADRLREAGFTVGERDYFAELTPGEQRRYGLRSEILYIVRKE
jgi:SAM-dependent methyltransferase